MPLRPRRNIIEKRLSVMKRNSARILFGLLFLCTAVLILGNAVGWWNIDSAGWWAMFLIIPGLAGMLDNGIDTWNTALVLIGVWLLAVNRGWLPAGISGSLIWVVILALIGLELLFGGTRRKWRYCGSGDPENFMNGVGVNRENMDSVSHTSVFTGQKIHNDSHSFRGAVLTTVFGGITLDLRSAVPVDGAVVDAVAIFGGITVFVPENCRVQVKGVPIFGGGGCRAERPDDPAFPLLTVRYTAIFGGVDVK